MLLESKSDLICTCSEGFFFENLLITAIQNEMISLLSSFLAQFDFRSAQFLQVMSDTQTIHEMQNLSMFLATQNKIKDTLKTELQAVSLISLIFRVTLLISCKLKSYRKCCWISRNDFEL